MKLAVYIVDFLNQEMDHLWELVRIEHRLQGLRAKNSFYLGLAKGFDEKMKESKANMAPIDQKSLIIVEKNLDKKIHQIYGRLSSTQSSHHADEKAGAIGILKGRDLTIRKGVEAGNKGLSLTYSKDF
jgi:hypothetical protein